MNRNSLFSVALLPLLVTGCATYESTPIHTTATMSSVVGYGAAPYYYSPGTVYVTPAPAYVIPPPVYVTPRPAFDIHAWPAPHHHHRGMDRPRPRQGKSVPPHEERTGNAAGSRIGGPGWKGTEWKR